MEHNKRACKCINEFLYNRKLNVISLASLRGKQLHNLVNRFYRAIRENDLCWNSHEATIVKNFFEERTKSLAKNLEDEQITTMPTIKFTVCHNCIREDLKAPNKLKYDKKI